MLPIRVLGTSIGSENTPVGANNSPICSCTDPAGLPSPGIAVGAWLPYRLFEAVRNPYCMPVFGGTFMADDWAALAGPRADAESAGNNDGAYYHVHVYSFPLAEMMELLTSKNCNPGGYVDMDLMIMTEVDPTASDDLLAMFIYFETAMFANPLAVAACGVECGQLSAGVRPTDEGYWWCAGCWGPLYPLTNSTNVRASKHSETSLISAKQLAIKHRRGMGHITYGSARMCGGEASPYLHKAQYRWQHLFPVPEARRPCCHWTGASEYITGGVSRERPTSGEDIVQMLFRYVDCCAH